MFTLLMIIHIVACIILIAVILLQAGRGGGLSEAFGSEGAESLLGTQAPVILKKATTISAILFIVTSLVLGMVTARRGRSLFDNMNLPAGATLPTATQPLEAAKEKAAESVPQETSGQEESN